MECEDKWHVLCVSPLINPFKGNTAAAVLLLPSPSDWLIISRNSLIDLIIVWTHLWKKITSVSQYAYLSGLLKHHRLYRSTVPILSMYQGMNAKCLYVFCSAHSVKDGSKSPSADLSQQSIPQCIVPPVVVNREGEYSSVSLLYHY